MAEAAEIRLKQQSQQEVDRLKQKINPKTEQELRDEFNQREQIMKEIRANVDEAISDGEIANKGDIPFNIVKNTAEMGKAITLRETVAQTVVAIQEGKIRLNGNNSVAINALSPVLSRMDWITASTSPYIYNLLQQAMNNRLGTVDQWLTVLESSDVQNIRYLDENLYKKMVGLLEKKAVGPGGLGANEDQKNKFDILKSSETEIVESREVGNISQQMDRIEKVFESMNDSVYMSLKSIKLSQQEKSRIRQQYMAEYILAIQNKTKSPKEIELLIDRDIAEQEQRMKGELANAYGQIGDAEPTKRVSRVIAFKTLLSGYMGVMDGGTGIEALIDRIEVFNNQHSETINRYGELRLAAKGNDLVRMLKGELDRAGVQIPSELMTLYVNLHDKDSFKNYFKKTYIEIDAEGKPKVKWNQFNEDVLGIFEEVLSTIDGRPKDFFDQAFNQLLEGNIYKSLQKTLQTLGEQLGSDQEFIDMGKVEIRGTEFLSKGTEYGELGRADLKGKTAKDLLVHNRLAQTNYQEISLGKAIGSYLYSDSQKLYRTSEYLHNVEVISTLGLGFEQLANYAKRIESDDIDWLMRRKANVPLAYMKYITNLQTELASNSQILMTNFGRQDDVDSLDPVERVTFRQLCAEEKYLTPQKEKAIKRQVRMAGSISKGFTGEFWGLLQSVSMPEFYTRDPKTGEMVVNPLFKSVSNTGVESMISQLNLDILLERFVLPNYLPQIRYAYSPRDLHNIPNPWSRDGQWDHTKVWEYGPQLEDAMFNGRSNKVIELDKKYLFMRDHLKTGGIDLFTRGGWRFEHIEGLRRYLNEGKGTLDYDATMINMKRMGRYAVKSFIDNICGADEGWKKLDDATIKKLTGENSLKDLEKKIKDEKDSHGHGPGILGALKLKMYEELIFERLIETNPSRFIGLETRRYTPKGELTVRQSLQAYIRTILPHYPEPARNDEILRGHINALEMVEKNVWWDRKEKGGPNDLDYIFGENDLRSPKHVEMLKRYYQQLKDSYHLERENDKTLIEWKETPEQFVENTIKIHKEMRRLIGSTKHRLTKTAGLTVQNEEKHYVMEVMGDENDRRAQKGHTLGKRYAEFMIQNYGNLNYLIGGDDFDFSLFKWQSSGNRPHQRMFNEVNALATKMNPALAKILTSEILEFAKGQYADVHAYEAAVQKHFVPGMKEIWEAINQQAKDQADEYVIRLEILLANVLAKDTQVRVKFAGDIFSEFRKKYNDMQPSLLAEYLADTWQRPITSLDSNQIKLFGELISNACNISFKETKLAGFTKGYNLGPFTFGRFRIAGAHHKISHEMYEAGVGSNGSLLKGTPLQFLTRIPGVAKLTDVAVLERHAPMVLMVLLLILAAMAKLAGDKNKGGKH